MELKWKYLAVLIVAVMIATVLLINKTTPWAYDIGACSINDYDCLAGGWNGQCTQNITDDCCTPVRMCGGTTSTPEECYTEYCTATGKMCVPEYNLQGTYDCKCVDAYSNL